MASIDVEGAGGPSRPSLRNLIVATLAAILRVIGLVIFTAAVFAVGVGSARYMITYGSSLSVDTYGPWTLWRSAGVEAADPYTRAHFAARGELRIASNSAGLYEATTDDIGARLHSSCNYLIEGPEPEGMWWSLSVFDSYGRLISNDANRYSFTRATAASNPDGSYIVSLGRDARPGNWLPTGGAGRLTLVLTLLDPATGLSDEERTDRSRLLPVIRREGCS